MAKPPSGMHYYGSNPLAACFYRRDHSVWSTKLGSKVLKRDIRVCDICRKVYDERGVNIIRDMLSADHVRILWSAPPKLAVSDLVWPMKRGLWGRRF